MKTKVVIISALILFFGLLCLSLENGDEKNPEAYSKSVISAVSLNHGMKETVKEATQEEPIPPSGGDTNFVGPCRKL